MTQNSTGTDQPGRSGEEFGSGKTQNITGVDLAHPPVSIEKLPDVDKRFLAGMIREGFTQGLETCQRQAGRPTDKRSNLRFADSWIASNVPFLSGVIGDVGEGSSSGR